jgi:FKBP-type peptidyl-prolyl cis-trans isomerase (trigger factor)
MQKTFIAVAVGAVVVAGGWYLFSNGGFIANNNNAGEVVARVNNEDVHLNELDAIELQMTSSQGVDIASLDESVRAELRSSAIDALINRTLLQQLITQADITTPAEDVDAEFALIMSQFPDESAFDAALAAEGLTEEELRTQIDIEFTTQAYLSQALDFDSLSATDEEILTTYAELTGGAEDAPALEEIRDQIETIVLQQKQQELVTALLEQLRADADIEILI